MIVGGYVFTLYCDGPKCPSGADGKPAYLELIGKNSKVIQRRLQESHWYLVKKEDKAFCPKCARAYKTTTAKPLPKNEKMLKTVMRKAKVPEMAA